MSPPPLARRRRTRALLFRLMFAAGLISAAWLAGLFWFAGSIPREVVDTRTRTDAIVVLTGGSGRLEVGFDLLVGDLGQRLFISGVFPGTEVRQLLTLFQRNPSYLEQRVDIGTAPDTIGNADETAIWIRQQGYTSLRLVTSGYHMPRSLLEFAEALPEVDLISHPVFSEHVKHSEWWAWPGTASLIVREYNKFLLAWTRHFLARGFTGTPRRRNDP